MKRALRQWTGWAYKRWMLFGIFLARNVTGLEKWKMAVGDGMVLACTLTMPHDPSMNPWPGGRLPLLVMFRPPKGSGGPHELWEAEPAVGGEPPARRQFHRSPLTAKPLYGGQVYFFITDNFDQPTHYFIRCSTVGHAHTDSGTVVSKLHVGPTRFTTDRVAVRRNGAIHFSWPPADDPTHWVHFLTVSQGDRLLTGIYSRGTAWTYPKLTDLPYYIHDPLDAPRLGAGDALDLMYMAVDVDGWVSDLCMRSVAGGSG